jgi:DNA-binding response OmpR family regulator
VIEILVVEDSATQARQLAQLLETAGYRVRIAADGRAGLEEARRQPPTLIVTDIAMPHMDGFEMCKAMKKEEGLRDIPVILLTSLSSLYDVIKGLDCGADNFIRSRSRPTTCSAASVSSWPTARCARTSGCSWG